MPALEWALHTFIRKSRKSHSGYLFQIFLALRTCLFFASEIGAVSGIEVSKS